MERNFIDISGAVNKEVKFQFVDGDKLSDAILFARGLNPAYTNIDSAQISRLSNNGLNEQLLNFSLSENPILLRGIELKF
ncbi:MAG: hypothetical protein H6613_00825 [Ignavibacteriales bacterium]|nr:hypothetical protein [Ignavibacteriales bacterium]